MYDYLVQEYNLVQEYKGCILIVHMTMKIYLWNKSYFCVYFIQFNLLTTNAPIIETSQLIYDGNIDR